MTDHIMKEPILRINDDYGVPWLWDGEWLDLDWSQWTEPRPAGSGYPAFSLGVVIDILLDGLWIEEPSRERIVAEYRKQRHERAVQATKDVAEVHSEEEIRRQAYLEQLRQRDEDPRLQDPFARPDWNGDPNEY
jgi:hypothetical protein